METPDKFIVLKITAPDYILYKVYGTWYGGYLGEDRWRLNSGIKGVNIHDDDYIDFIGYSGSVYRCVIGHNCYGTSLYSQGVLNNIIKVGKEEYNTDIEIMPEDTDWSKLFNKE